MTTLYNKVDYLQKINSRGQARGGRGRPGGARGQNMQGRGADEEEEEESIFRKILDNSLRMMMSVRNVSINYNESNGMVLPGFEPEPTILGHNFNLNAPGLGFVFGEQSDIQRRAIENNWLTTSDRLNAAYMKKHTQTLNARATIEPFRNFNIQVTASRNASESFQSYFRADSLGNFQNYSPTERGDFSISYLTWNTAFITDHPSTYSNENFENFQSYLMTIANRLSGNNPHSDFNTRDSLGFPDGYSMTQQDVMVPAFLAAYTGRDPENQSLSYFPSIPMPNWRITFTGLTQIDFIGKYFRNIAINHSYNSTYTINSFESNMHYREGDDGFQYVRNQTNVFFPKHDINQIMINEQFSPLISLNMTMHNSLMARVEIRKSRNLALSFANNQVTEVSSNEYVFGTGYRIKDLEFVVTSGGQARRLSSDLNIKVDVSIRDNKTILRKMVEDANQISAGQKVVSINTSADYMISQSINLRVFYDQVINNPYVSTQFPNSNINAGLGLSFMLAQ